MKVNFVLVGQNGYMDEAEDCVKYCIETVNQWRKKDGSPSVTFNVLKAKTKYKALELLSTLSPGKNIALIEGEDDSDVYSTAKDLRVKAAFEEVFSTRLFDRVPDPSEARAVNGGYVRLRGTKVLEKVQERERYKEVPQRYEAALRARLEPLLKALDGYQMRMGPDYALDDVQPKPATEAEKPAVGPEGRASADPAPGRGAEPRKEKPPLGPETNYLSKRQKLVGDERLATGP